MNTVFINCSPKQKLSVSNFLAKFTGFFVGGEKTYLNLRTPKDADVIIPKLENADAIVFAIPLYVDGLPSHMLPVLKKIEEACKEKNISAKVYVVANNGFIEGKQNEPLMQVMENFCNRSNLTWCGGLGIGGGVMLNVMRILIVVFFGIMLLNIALSSAQAGAFVWYDQVMDYLGDLVEVLFFGCGIIVFDIWLAICIRKGKDYGKHYTRIMLPSFLFILGADFFFIIISILQGGILRGWLSKKKVSE